MAWIGVSSYDKYTHIIGGIIMPMKQTGRKVYKSMQGKTVDMDLLRQRNELTPAVGNARVNARGDELGPGGQIFRKREDVMREYYQKGGSMPDEIPVKKSTNVSEEDDWEEDTEGNFVKKGK
jgi:hypothetical protein